MRDARCLVALTGAGISTSSGIPDFRSTGSGLWTQADGMVVASLTTFRHAPERFFEWARPVATCMLRAQPNRAHRALASLEQAGQLQAVITQNVDDLHRRSGSSEVIELHGSFRRATCTGCFSEFDTQGLLEGWLTSTDLPCCPRCGSLVKPNVILFGEQLPHAALDRAFRWAQECDLFLVVGSSLEVNPAAGLPFQALCSGAELIIVNQEPTYLDARAAWVFRQPAADILTALADEVLCERSPA
jgi:NAD-dependent deacetylase